MPANPPPTDTKSEAWLAWALREWQDRQVDVNKELYRSLGGIARRLGAAEKKLDRVLVLIVLVGPLLQILVGSIMALLVNRLLK